MSVNTLTSSPLAGLAGVASGVWGFLVTLVKSAQWARMVQVLSAMSDRQLAGLGITRGDIPDHAQKLVFGDR